MADVNQEVAITLTVRDQASAPSAKVTAAITAMGNASSVAAEKAAALTAATSTARAASSAVTQAQRTLTTATRGGDPDRIAAARAELEAARAADVEAKAAQASARAALQVAREAKSAASAAVTSAERESAQAAAALAKQEAAAARTAAEITAVTRERQNELAVVDQLTLRIADLQKEQTAAGASASVGIGREIAGLQGSVAAHRDEAIALDVKLAKLREVAAVAAAGSEEERAAIRLATDARLVEIRVMREQQAAALAAASSPAAPKAAGAAAETGGFGAGLGEIGSLIALTAATVGVGKLTEKMRESVAAARDSQEAQERLQAALGDSAAAYERVTAAAGTISAGSRYGRDDLTGAAQSLVDRGVPVSDLPKALKATADVAAAMKRPLADVAEQIAVTFGGTVPRDLGRAVPALHALTEESLKAGAALDLLENRYGGRALSDALTPSGREAVAWRELSESFKELGRSLLPIVEEYGPKLAKLAATGVSVVSHAGDVPQALTERLQDAMASVGLVDSDTLHTVRLKESTDRANAQLAELAAQADAQRNAALQHVTELQKDIADQTATFDAGQSAKHQQAVQRDVADEFRARTVGVQRYLAAIDAAAAAERSQPEKELVDLKEQAGSAAGTADAARAVNAIGSTATPAQKAAAAKDEEEAYQTLADLSAKILAIREKIADVDRKAAADRAKAIAEAGQQAEQDAGNAGQKLTGQLGEIGRTDQLNPLAGYAQAAAAADQYRMAIALAELQLDGLIDAAKKAGDAVQAQKLADIKLKVTVDADKTLAQVHTLAGDIHAALEQPLAGAFDRMLETQGGFNQRLRAGAASFLESISQMLAQFAAKMAANAILTGLFGDKNDATDPDAGKKSGSTGQGILGLLAQFGVAFVSGLAGGAVKGLGAGSSGGDDGKGFGGGASGGSFDDAGAGASDSGGGFAEGGYTGNGRTSEAAGIVHKGEYVLHSRAVSRYGIASLSRMNEGGVHPVALAGLAASDAQVAGPAAPSVSSAILAAGTDGIQSGGGSVPMATNAEGGGHTFTPVIVLNEQVAAQFGSSQAFLRAQARAQIGNPAIYKPVHKALGG